MTTRSFYSAPETERIIETKASPERGGISDIINRSVQRLQEVVRQHRPRLTESEWMLIFDALNGVLHEDPASVNGVWIGIEDAIRLDHLDTKWTVDGDALVHKLERLGYAGNLAIVETAEQFWSGTQGAETKEDIFKRLGFQPKPF